MALPPLAQVSDLAAWVGREIPDTDPRAGAVLSHASTRVRTYARTSWTDDAGVLTAVPDIVRDVTVRVAARAWRNPDDLESITLDDGTKRWGSARGLALTDEDKEDLADFRGDALPGGLGVVSTYRGDLPHDNTVYVPTGPPPSGYPFPFLHPDDL